MLGVFSVFSFLVEARRAVFIPYFSLYLKEELAASYTQIGIILTLILGLNALFQIVWGWTSDRVAKRKHFLILGEGIPGLVFPFIPQITDIAVLAIVLPAVSILWSMAAPSWKALIAEHSNPGERGELMGKITTCGGVGAIIALPIVADLIDRVGYSYFFYFSALCMLLASLTSFFIKEPEGLKPSQQRLLSMEQLKIFCTDHRPFSLFTILILLTLFASRLIEGFISLYATGLGANVHQVGYLFMLRDGTETAFMIPMGRLTDRIGKVKMLKFALVISAFAILGFAAAKVWWYLLFAVVVESIGYSGYHVSSFAVLSSLTPREMRGTYMGFHSMMASFSFLASSVGGSIADGFGLKILFLVSFVFSILVALYFVTWLQKNHEIIDQSPN